MGNDEIEVDDEIVSIEASKTVLDVQSPLAGKIVERNTKAEDEPTILNSEKPEENWLIKLENVDERSEEHTSELQSRFDLVCRLLLEKKKTTNKNQTVVKNRKQTEQRT